MTSTTVPGMAEAIDRRWKERYHSVTELADAAGITRQGLDPIRRGVRKSYQDKLKLGVARALDWPDDAIDRLLAGDDPDTMPTVVRPRADDPIEQLRAEVAKDREERAALRRELDEVRQLLLEWKSRSPSPEPIEG